MIKANAGFILKLTRSVREHGIKGRLNGDGKVSIQMIRKFIQDLSKELLETTYKARLSGKLTGLE